MLINSIINNLIEHNITQSDLSYILNDASEDELNFLFFKAREIRELHYGKEVYIRGLIEFTNYCRNDCFYCGIRKSNTKAMRYRLSKDDILSCCKSGYELGYRTFVLQGGEDGYYSRDVLADIIASIHKLYPDCAITLSFGEWNYEDYKCWFDAGADRYLLRHETATEAHYKLLHPDYMSLSNRKKCLQNLKEIGYQVGAGFMVGSPNQNIEYLWNDLQFLLDLQPAMVGIGPFISHKDTPFSTKGNGNLQDTIRLLAIIRLLLPKVLLPATTALGTIAPNGRELGLMAGANVIMPNLSPISVRDKYDLYNNKKSTGEEAAECKNSIEQAILSTGYYVVSDRGDSKLIPS